MLLISSQPPRGSDGKIAAAHIGKLGPHSLVDDARETAGFCAINLLAQVAWLDGFFNGAVDFDSLPRAMNGAPDLKAALFGKRGRHARISVDVSHPPLNAMAEIEAIFEVA